jgi:hypothetical protein
MQKSRKQKLKIQQLVAPKESLETREEKVLHVRRCHVCNGVTESLEIVKRCDHCHKAIAPYYFYEEADVIAWADNEVRPAPVPDKPEPVRGLSLCW